MAEKSNLTIIDDFARAYGPIKAAVSELSLDMMTFIPNEPASAWSINDHLVHLLDIDTILWYRARVAIAEPGTVVAVVDEEIWKRNLGYSFMDGRVDIILAETLRATLADSLRPIADEDWSLYWISHPKRGKMHLSDILELYTDHAAFHLKYIERNIKAWKARNKA